MDRSGTQLTLTVDWPEITLDKLTRLTSLWSNVIHAVSAQAAGKRDALKWVLTGLSFASPVQVQTVPVVARTRVDPVVLSTVSHAVVAGVRQLGDHSERPDHFSTHALELMRKLALLSDGGSVVVSNGVGEPVPITHRVAATVDDILGPEVESYGSVEGHLEGIFTHGRRVLYVYDSLSGRQVRCFFDAEATPLDALLKYFQHRVIVSGLVRSKAFTGEPKSIDVSEIRDFQPDRDLLSPAEILRTWEPDA